MQHDPPADRILKGLTNTRLVGILIALGTVVIALSTFTDAAKNLVGLVKGETPERARAELAGLSVPYTPQAFVERTRKGDVQAVKLFVAAGMDPNAKDDDNNTALMNAIAEHRIDVVNVLLGAKADVNEKNGGGATALDWAAARGQLDTVRLLLDKGANQNAVNEAVVAAAQAGHADIVRVLLDKGAKAHEVGARALLAAAGSTVVGAEDRNLSETVRLLLRLGVDVNAKDNEGWTALLMAADQDRTSVAQALLEGGADVNARCACPGYLSGGWTALMIAARDGHVGMVKMLVANRADVAIRNNGGETALTVANGHPDPEIVRMLRTHGS